MWDKIDSNFKDLKCNNLFSEVRVDFIWILVKYDKQNEQSENRNILPSSE